MLWLIVSPYSLCGWIFKFPPCVRWSNFSGEFAFLSTLFIFKRGWQGVMQEPGGVGCESKE